MSTALQNSVFPHGALLIFYFYFFLLPVSKEYSNTSYTQTQKHFWRGANLLSGAMVTLPAQAADTGRGDELLCKYPCSLPLRLSGFQNKQQQKAL